MPWWAITYLVALVMMIIVALIKDARDQRSRLYMLGEFTSGTAGFLMVYGYFSTSLGSLIGWFVFPLLAYALFWDQYALRHMKKSNYPDLSAEENADMDRYSKLFAILFVSPCYIAGILGGWRLLAS